MEKPKQIILAIIMGSLCIAGAQTVNAGQTSLLPGTREAWGITQKEITAIRSDGGRGPRIGSPGRPGPRFRTAPRGTYRSYPPYGRHYRSYGRTYPPYGPYENRYYGPYYPYGQGYDGPYRPYYRPRAPYSPYDRPYYGWRDYDPAYPPG